MAGKSKSIKTIICILICLSLVVTAIGIGVPIYALSNTEKTYEQLEKKKVPFDSSGAYTISFNERKMLKVLDDGSLQETSEDLPVEFESIAKEDITVSYGYLTSTEKAEAASDKGVNDIEVIRKNAEITGFQNDGKQINVSFNDDKDFPNNGNDCYIISIEKAKRAVIIEPQIPDNTLSSNTKEVSSESTQNTIIVTSKEGNFSPTIKPEDVSLDYSFRDMKVESVVPDGKKLMINLSGTPVIIPEISTVYTDGEIEIAPSGFEKANKPEEITFEISVPLVAIDTSAITESNGTYTVPINVSGVDVSKLNEDTIDFGDNTKVKSVTTKNGQVIAEVEAEDMDSLGGHVKIGDNTYLSGYSHASVGIMPLSYSKEGDNFVLDIFVVAKNGKIKKNLDKSQINLLDDFEGGSIVSLEEQEDQNITLRIEVPSNGVSIEDMNLYGTLEFTEGALVEDWGDSAPAYFITATYNQDLFEVIISSDMSNDTTGLSMSSMLASLFGNVVYAAQPDANNNAAANNNNNGNNNNNNNAQAGNANNNAQANNNGNANNNAQANNNNNAAANNNNNNFDKSLDERALKTKAWGAGDILVNYTVDKLQKVNSTAAAIGTWGKIGYNFAKGIISKDPSALASGLLGIFDAMGLFDGGEDPNNPSNKTVEDKLDDVNVLLHAMDEKLDTVLKNQYKAMTQGYENALDMLRTDCKTVVAMIQAAKEIYKSRGGVVPTKTSTKEQLDKYNADLVKIIFEEEKKNNSTFRGYSDAIRRIESNYNLVTTETYKPWDKNPIYYNDKIWSEYFNYESQGYYLREAYRTNVRFRIEQAYRVLSFHYEMSANPDTHITVAERYTQALDMIDEHPAGTEPTELLYPTMDADQSKTLYNSELTTPVYSSTLNKMVTGWYIPTNGVTNVGKITYKNGFFSSEIVQQFETYPGSKDICEKYISKLHGKTVMDDLDLAFPGIGNVIINNYPNYQERRIGDPIHGEVQQRPVGAIGFGGQWARSKWRGFLNGDASGKTWRWWENAINTLGEYHSLNTYDTIVDTRWGDDPFPDNPVILLRFKYK